MNGSDVALTLDHDVDWYVKQALLEGQKKTKATWAMAVVQDIQTGEILALEDTDEYQAGSDQAKLNASRAVSRSSNRLGGQGHHDVRTAADRAAQGDRQVHCALFVHQGRAGIP